MIHRSHEGMDNGEQQYSGKIDKCLMKEKSDLDLVICSSCQATSYTRVAHRI